jgi:TRAP-type C4-dicarboxylate transport system substrate-binding protein
MEAMSNGRIKVDMYPGGGLVAWGEQMEALRMGTLDLYFMEHMWKSLIPVTMIEMYATQLGPEAYAMKVLYDNRKDYEGLPFGFGLLDVVRAAYLEQQDVYYILPSFNDVGNFFLRFPISKWEDLKGHKVYMYSHMADVLAPRTGVTVVDRPPEELYTSLAAGIIEGVGFGAAACGWDMGWHEVTSYMIEWPCNYNPVQNALLMAPDKWHALPDDIKAIVKNAFTQNIEYMKTAYYYRETYKKKVMEEDYGIEMINLPQEEGDKYYGWVMEELEEVMGLDEYCREAGEIVKEWVQFYDLAEID